MMKGAKGTGTAPKMWEAASDPSILRPSVQLLSLVCALYWVTPHALEIE